ncbi:MAG: hypothetical protein HZA54_11385, partial [Planctomycetes bacterium]|nr:hypothetical protein [Planctomycetota bacterium]
AAAAVRGGNGTPVRHGRALLAVLKADVDRLGEIFARGLGERMSLARYAALSRMLDYFFGARLMRILQEEFPDTYTIYAGGDDLLLVGPWDAMLELAARIHQAFTVFVGGTGEVTLSAAVVLASPRVPIRRAADLAEAELHRAKEAGRDRVSVFGQVMTWSGYAAGRAAPDVGDWGALEQGKWLAQRFSGAHAPPRALLQQLLRFARLAGRAAQGGAAALADPAVLLWPAHYRYQVARNLFRDESSRGMDAAERRFWNELGEIPRPGVVPRMARLQVPIEYALHRLRRAH